MSDILALVRTERHACPVVAGLRLNKAALAALSPAERAQVQVLLAEAETIVRDNPLELYRPATEKHARAHAAHVPVRIIEGGNRSGKTTFGIVDTAIQVAPEELVPPHLRQYKTASCPFYCRIVTPDMERTMKPVIWAKLQEWLPRALLRKDTVLDSIDRAANTLRLECGCRLDFLSYEMGFDKFGGAALHRVLYDEEPPKPIREECLWRLVDFNGDELFTMTPLKGTTSLIRGLKRQAAGHPELVHVETISMLENPHLSAEARERIIDSARDDPRMRSRIYGEVWDIGGPVYPDWEGTLVPRIDWAALRSMEHVIGIDPGIRYCGIAYQAFDDDSNRAHTYRGVKLYGADVEHYQRELKMTLARMGLHTDSENVHFVIDPNAVARSAVDGRNVFDELAEFGILCETGNNKVEAGVLLQRRRDRFRWSTIADDDDTMDLRDELESYVMEIDEEADDGTFKVRKQDDHICDARRYGLMSRPWLPEGVQADKPEREPIAWWERADGPKRRLPDLAVY